MKLVRMKWYTLGCVMVVLITLLLSGCDVLEYLSPLPLPLPSGTPGPVPSVSATPTPSPTATPTLTPAPRVITLDLWVPDFLNPHEEIPGAFTFNNQLNDFTVAYPDIQVRTIVKKDTGPGGLYDLLSSASGVAPSVLPDLIVLNQNDLQTAAEDGLLQPLNEDILTEADYFPAPAAAMQTQDSVWGLPYVAQAEQMAYRTGITETVPLSWTTVLTSDYSMLIPGAPADALASDTLLAIYMGSGGRLTDDNGQPTLERASLENVYSFFLEMQQTGRLDPETVLNLATTSACWEAYQQGTAELTPVSMGLYWFDPPEDTLPTWAPTAEGAPMTVIHTWGIAVVTDNPARRETAMKLAQWLTTPQRMATLTQAAQLVPTRRESVEMLGLLPDETTFVNLLLSNGSPAPPPNVDLAVRRALQSGLTALLLEEVDTPNAAASYALTNLRR